MCGIGEPRSLSPIISEMLVCPPHRFLIGCLRPGSYVFRIRWNEPCLSSVCTRFVRALYFLPIVVLILSVSAPGAALKHQFLGRCRGFFFVLPKHVVRTCFYGVAVFFFMPKHVKWIQARTTAALRTEEIARNGVAAGVMLV